ncbi:nucleoside hydrolase [Microcoleus sp. FACHB-831]|uniref:nucleoside hydrolase n=1 Tax=Microcoleus sp. FACHB-831 TaxID=2692827 RepID=UPI001688D418|nr:nucleoside hydrolase [Microcoleus sp. FACHB-831]MBD1921729.1 nucleoside hydrolase [Microcoleus sp. FACHB-831]
MIDVVWDMETGDPDDFLTLLLLIGHPEVNLKAVTITPGTPDQIGLVRYAIAEFNLDIPVGAYNIEHPKQCVSKWHYDTYGNIPPSRDAEPGGEILLRYCDENTTLITGCPLKNVGSAMKLNFKVGRLFAQGGFAGEGVVPSEKQLDKFKGMVTCPTYNLNGDSKSALAALSYSGINIRRFVSKNVCHGVYYDQNMHEYFAAVKAKSKSLAWIWQGMDVYLRSHQSGKKFHDPLAACCAIDESIATWAEVELYREKGQWGSRLSPGSGTWIIIDYDSEKFISTLTAY